MLKRCKIEVKLTIIHSKSQEFLLGYSQKILKMRGYVRL